MNGRPQRLRPRSSVWMRSSRIGLRCGSKIAAPHMAMTRTHFPYRIDRWDEADDNIMEQRGSPRPDLGEGNL